MKCVYCQTAVSQVCQPDKSCHNGSFFAPFRSQARAPSWLLCLEHVLKWDLHETGIDPGDANSI